MHVPIIPLVIVAFTLIINASAATNRCYNPKSDFYELLGTRTAYELVRGHGNLRPLNDPKCKPLQLWTLVRHGTKFPENKYIKGLQGLLKLRDQIVKNHEKYGAGELCKKDLQYLRNWKMDLMINDKTDEELAPQGEKDLENFAKRLKKAYPELLQVDPETFKPSDFIFEATNEQRTEMSMLFFLKGLFGNNDTQHIDQFSGTVAPENDTTLTPHENCKVWNTDYKKLNLGHEHKKFVKGHEMKEVLKNVSKRLGFKKTLDYDTLKAAYDMCRYEVAWYPGTISTWCSIFKKQDLEVMEYSEDLDSYYYCGPGREMSSQIGCMTVSDMFKRFKDIEDGNETNQPKGVFYFAHTKTIQTALAALNIGKEETPFTANSYARATNRKYHASKLGPFATNLLAVFYRCDEGIKPTYKVSLHVAEIAAPVDICENGLCEWESLKQEYGPMVDSCNLNFCDPKKSKFNFYTSLFVKALGDSVGQVQNF